MQSIIAAFKDTSTAQQAIERLVEQGFARSAIHLQSAYDEAPAAAGRKVSLTDPFGFSTFFSTLFGAQASAEAGKYAEAVRRGTTVVVVDVTSEEESDAAARLLQELGSIDVDQHAQEWQRQGWQGFDAAAKPLSREELSAEQQKVVPVVQEELQVNKRAVEGGGVRVVKRVTETPVSETVTLRDERTTVERRPVDRAATPADLQNFEEATIEVRDVSEQAVVGKTARVVEEVVVGKEVTERTEEINDTVRRTDVEVERVADVKVEREAGAKADAKADAKAGARKAGADATTAN